MNHKVLLADDSLTIQKVIKITLANQPYDITEASSEEELFRQLPILQPKLVFLDFNLSEKYTGYELTTKIKTISPSTKVLLLLGTFDTVEDAAMEKCGASDKIVKPFDSNKFIAICKQLIDTFGNEEIPYPETKKETKPVIQDEPEDQWTVSHSSAHNLPVEEPKVEVQHQAQNALHKEVSDWGMSIPGIINDSTPDEMTLPPVIGEVKSLHEHREKKAEAPQKPEPAKEEAKFPQADDLDYPTIEETLSSAQPEKKPEAPTSKLISIESFNEKPMDLELQGSYVPEETDIKSLEDQIRDEVEEDLWKVDEFEDLKNEISEKIEEMKSNFKPTLNDFDESLFKPIDDSASIDWSENETLVKPAEEEFQVHHEPAAQEITFGAHSTQPDMSALRSEIEDMVKKYVKQYMDEMFQKNTEKVAWEVIPDLAENLIRQELSKISNKILNEN